MFKMFILKLPFILLSRILFYTLIKTFNLFVFSIYLNEGFNSVLWTFPPSKPSSVEFFSSFLKNVPTIILSSIGVFNPPTDDIQIDENFKLEENGRYETEEILRKEGATILYLGGIYGPGRDPLSWYQKGWIPNGETYLNLIHVGNIR